ncbi:MAG: hypothetical protein N3B14_06645 [Thermoleophilia bacterium]|nr:hypothetical protein [Thermoleophilia bacterium]
MSKKERREPDQHETTVDEEQQQPQQPQQTAEPERSERQEGDSVAALKAILSKVSALLKPLQLTPEESIKLVEDLYASVLAMDLQLAGETDDKRKASVLAHIENTSITREDGRIVVTFPTAATSAAGQAEASQAEASQAEAVQADSVSPDGSSPASSGPNPPKGEQSQG